MSHVHIMQPILTEDEIFSSPVISPPGAGSEDFGDGAEEYLEALRWEHHSESEAALHWSMNSANGVHVHRSAPHQQVEAAPGMQGELIPYDPAFVMHRLQTWPNEGVNQAAAQEGHRRPRQRRSAGSFRNAVAGITLRPVAIRPDHPQLQKFRSPLHRRRGPASASLRPVGAPKPAAKRRRSNRPASPLTRNNDQLAAVPTEYPWTIVHNFSKTSKLVFPFQLMRPNFQLIEKPATTTMPSLDPVYSDATRATDHRFGSIPSSAPVQNFFNTVPALVKRALVGLSPAIVVDSTVTTTTRIIDSSQTQVLAVHDLSADSECQLLNDLPEASSSGPEYQQVEWPNCIDYMDMSRDTEQAPEPVPAEFQVTKSLCLDSNSQPAAISSSLVTKQSSRTKKQGRRKALEGSPGPYAVGTHEHSMAAAANNGRLRWTPELHDKFVAAVTALGGSEKATPKGVLRVMACPEITIFHVKSHLQKFRILPVPGQCAKRQRYERGLEAAVATEQMALDLEENVELQQEMQDRLRKQLETTKDLQRRIDEQSAQLKRMLDLQQAQREAAGLQFALANTSAALTQLPGQPSPKQPACDSVQVPRLLIVPNPLLYAPAAGNPHGVEIASPAGRRSSTSSPEVQPTLITSEPIINHVIDSLEAEEMATPTE